jgi:hypothetical protein
VLFVAVTWIIVLRLIRTDPKTRTAAAIIHPLLLGVGSFAFVLFVPIMIMAGHQSAMRAAVGHGNYLSVTGKLAAVRSETFTEGKDPDVHEFDVLTLNQGSSFEIDCSRQSRELPRKRQPYGCLDAQIGDDLTIASSGSLGMHGSVPALRV